MPRKPLDFDAVRAIALTLPDVEESTTARGTSLKVRKRLLACPATHKSAEPGTLMVRLSSAERDRLVTEQPSVFYVTDHYESYPSLLVRLSKIRKGALRELLGAAWRFAVE